MTFEEMFKCFIETELADRLSTAVTQGETLINEPFKVIATNDIFNNPFGDSADGIRVNIKGGNIVRNTVPGIDLNTTNLLITIIAKLNDKNKVKQAIEDIAVDYNAVYTKLTDGTTEYNTSFIFGAPSVTGQPYDTSSPKATIKVVNMALAATAVYSADLPLRPIDFKLKVGTTAAGQTTWETYPINGVQFYDMSATENSQPRQRAGEVDLDQEPLSDVSAVSITVSQLATDDLQNLFFNKLKGETGVSAKKLKLIVDGAEADVKTFSYTLAYVNKASAYNLIFTI